MSTRFSLRGRRGQSGREATDVNRISHKELVSFIHDEFTETVPEDAAAKCHQRPAKAGRSHLANVIEQPKHVAGSNPEKAKQEGSEGEFRAPAENQSSKSD
jgi:hypothetical protein